MITRQELASHTRVLDQTQARADAAVAMLDEYDGQNGIDLPDWATLRFIIGELQTAVTNTKVVALVHMDDAQKNIEAIDRRNAERKRF